LSEIFSDRLGNQQRFRTLEDTIIDLSNEISSLKMQIARINAKLAVEVRKSKKATINDKMDRELQQIERQLGGNIVDIQEPEEINGVSDKP